MRHVNGVTRATRVAPMRPHDRPAFQHPKGPR